MILNGSIDSFETYWLTSGPLKMTDLKWLQNINSTEHNSAQAWFDTARLYTTRTRYVETLYCWSSTAPAHHQTDNWTSLNLYIAQIQHDETQHHANLTMSKLIDAKTWHVEILRRMNSTHPKLYTVHNRHIQILHRLNSTQSQLNSARTRHTNTGHRTKSTQPKLNTRLMAVRLNIASA